MSHSGFRQTRRTFIATAAAAAALPRAAGAAPAARYRRYNVTSPKGQQMLASYRRGVEAMLRLPATDPLNWFRNAFVHLMDCPHGNWWFYVWHRAYLGYFEQTIRRLSGDPEFAIPYWDWTQLPQIPDGMFDGVLTPTAAGFAPYTRDLNTFTRYVQGPVLSYWNALSAMQRQQLQRRGYASFQNMWNDVTGNGDPTNQAFAVTDRARYLTRTNPKLDTKTAYDVSAFVVYSGLLPTSFNAPQGPLSFTSSRTASHNTAPSGATIFSTLEGMPHNKTHNYIGGYGYWKAPWGNMTNNLSPVDPIFFLHHSNMDRLWDVWTRKQISLRQPYLPTGSAWTSFAQEPFLFYVGADGRPVGPVTAGGYVDKARFGYDYEPGFGEDVIAAPALLGSGPGAGAAFVGHVQGGAGSVRVPRALIASHLAGRGAGLFAHVTLDRSAAGGEREFDVLVNAPAGMTSAPPGSPYYAGTIAFFGAPMQHMDMSGGSTFAVPLPQAPQSFAAMEGGAEAAVSIRVVPSHGQGGGARVLQSVRVQAR